MEIERKLQQEEVSVKPTVKKHQTEHHLRMIRGRDEEDKDEGKKDGKRGRRKNVAGSVSEMSGTRGSVKFEGANSAEEMYATNAFAAGRSTKEKEVNAPSKKKKPQKNQGKSASSMFARSAGRR